LPEEIFAAAEGEPIAVEIHPTNTWQFPVVCDGTPRTLLTVSHVGGRWEAFDLGGLSPVVEMEDLGRVWQPAEGYELRYVRIYQTGSQFIAVTRDGKAHLVPVEWTARSLGMLEEGEVFQYKLMEIPDVAVILAPHIRASLEMMQE
jgi:hypothetical protein